MEKGCSFKPKYLMIASVFIVCGNYGDSMLLISAICQVEGKVAGNFGTKG